MLSKLQFKKLDNKGIVPFQISKDLSLEILTDKPCNEGIVKTFSKNGTFYGELVAVKIHHKSKDGNYIHAGDGVGLMIVNEDSTGCWIIPSKLAKEVYNVDGISEELELNTKPNNLEDVEVNDKLSFLNKKAFGFTIKQIIVVSALILIIKKI